MSIYRQNRSEFDWEREIRRDERRISKYYRELMYCLDLPGEEEMIYDQLAAHPGLVPAGSDPAHWRLWDCLDLDPEEENAAGEPRRRRKRPGKARLPCARRSVEQDVQPPAMPPRAEHLLQYGSVV